MKQKRKIDEQINRVLGLEPWDQLYRQTTDYSGAGGGKDYL